MLVERRMRYVMLVKIDTGVVVDASSNLPANCCLVRSRRCLKIEKKHARAWTRPA